MAPPSNRRTGFSKRAQYNVFYGYIAATAGALLGVALLLVALFNPQAFSSLRGLAADTTAPVGKAVSEGRSESGSVLSAIGGFFVSGRETARLKQEVELARIRLAEADALRAENDRLKALMGMPRDAGQLPIATARLIASTATSSRRFAVLSAGSAAGVAPGMPVRSPQGLVGRVLEVSPSSARVLLITDTESMVPVRRTRDSIDAFAQGRGDGMLVLRLVNLGLNPLKLGDVMVTSGSGGLYRPGIAVAVVTSLTRDGALARVLSDPSASEFVEVDPSFSAALKMPNPDAVQAAQASPASGKH